MQKKIKSFDDVGINYSVERISEFFLVFIQGVGSDLSSWKKVRQFFHKKGFSTLALDLRGHGLSDRPNSVKDYKLEYFAKDVYKVIKTEKIRRFILIGYCFGGIITIKFHELFPSLSKAYILINTSYKARKPLRMLDKWSPLRYILNNILEETGQKTRRFHYAKSDKFMGTGDWNLRRIYSDIKHTTFKSWIFTFETIANFDGTKTLKSINEPVLIIQGLKDSFVLPETAEKMHKMIKSSKVEFIPNTNHLILLNNNRILERRILLYLETIDKFIYYKKFLKQKVS